MEAEETNAAGKPLREIRRSWIRNAPISALHPESFEREGLPEVAGEERVGRMMLQMQHGREGMGGRGAPR